MSGLHNTRPKRGIDRLLKVVATLRGKGGCPWDREQTLESLKQYLIEESYELIDAIDSQDVEHHKEELGDLLLQVVLQAQIRNEKNEFSFDEVADKLAGKLIRRHPHVFGDAKVKNSREVLKNWEKIKSEEKKQKHKSALGEMPRYLPALQRAQRIQNRAARVGFDWANVKDVLAKIEEEVGETKQAIADSDAAAVKHELGDLLFAVVNLSRFQNMGAEECLDAAIKRFARRFRGIEQRIHAEGRKLADCSPAELDAHWEAVKNEE